MVLTEIQKEKKRKKMKIWREKNKEKYKEINRKHQKKHRKKLQELKNLNKKKFKKIKYTKLRFHCLFCNRSRLVCTRNYHKITKIHKKNVLKFNNILKNKKKLLKKIV